MARMLPMLQESGHPYVVPSGKFIEERIDAAAEIFLVPFLDGHLFYSPLANTSMLLDEFGAGAVRKHVRSEPLLPEERQLVAQLEARDVFRTPAAAGVERDDDAEEDAWTPTSATFSNTQKCTLRCKYCYAEGGRLEDLEIPWPVAKAAIDLIIKNALARGLSPSISFLGEGEATASWREFTGIIDYFTEQCTAHSLAPTVSLSTNGVFARSRVDYIVEHCSHITFSLDGLRDVHDQHRVLPNGGGSFDRIIETMQELDRRGKSYDIRSTVTVAGCANLPGFVRFVGEHLKCKSIHFEPIFDVTGLTRLGGAIESLDPALFVTGFRDARRVAAGFGIELYYSGAALTQRQTFCGASDASNFLVTSRGIVTSCNEVLQPTDPRAALFQYGNWDEQAGAFVVNQAKINRLKKLNVHEMPKCQGCIAKYNCAGDCYAKSAAAAPGGEPAAAAYTERCYITRELLKDNLLIELLTQQVGRPTAPRPRPSDCL